MKISDIRFPTKINSYNSNNKVYFEINFRILIKTSTSLEILYYIDLILFKNMRIVKLTNFSLFNIN